MRSVGGSPEDGVAEGREERRWRWRWEERERWRRSKAAEARPRKTKKREVRRIMMMAFRRSERTFGFAFDGGGTNTATGGDRPS